MSDFGYSRRGQAVEEARAECNSAFNDVVNRNDERDPKTRRWLDAIEAFRLAYARVYSDALRQVDEGTMQAEELCTADILDFLEADPVFFRSGYMKEKLLTEMKRRRVDPDERIRLQAIIIDVVQKPDHRREFLYYCRVAPIVDDQHFRDELERLEKASSQEIGRRANWILAGLNGQWEAIKRASRAIQTEVSTGYRARVPSRVSRDSA